MRIDMHTHTYYSDDAVNSPEDLVRVAKAKGLDGVALTDHDTTKAWREAIRAGKKHGLMVIPCEEIEVRHDGRKIGEVLGLFLKEEIRPGEFHAVRDRIHEQGGLLAVSHPCDFLRNNFRMLDELKKFYDAVEAFNARVVFNSFNGKAMEFAERNGIAKIGGSDAHCGFEIGNGVTVADADDPDGLLAAIRHKKTKVMGKKTNPLIHIVSTMAKLGLIGRK